MEGILAMQSLCSKGDLEAVKILAETAQKDDFAVHLSVVNGHFSIVQFLFEKWNGLDVNRPLQWACYSGQLEIALFLLEKGADVNSRGQYTPQYTPLEAACIRGCMEIIHFLVEKGADVTAFDNIALQSASKQGHLEVIKFLLENGADIHANHDFAVRWASGACHLEMVKFLVEKGADVNAGLENVRRGGERHFKIAKFLVEKGGDRSLLSEKSKEYVESCEKVEISAANKIGSWWIPICYDVNRECGKRMMERSWERVKAMYAQL